MSDYRPSPMPELPPETAETMMGWERLSFWGSSAIAEWKRPDAPHLVYYGYATPDDMAKWLLAQGYSFHYTQDARSVRLLLIPPKPDWRCPAITDESINSALRSAVMTVYIRMKEDAGV
jgi:hypothetical protein